MRLRAQKGTIMTVEYKVRPITRYVVTRFHEDGDNAGCDQHGTYDNAGTAYTVAYALCKAEHDKSGAPAGSMDFIYPDLPAGS